LQFALSQRRPQRDVPEVRLRTLGSSFLALLVQAPAEGAPAVTSPGVLELLAQSTIVAKTVLVILAVLSIVSWSITFYKWWTFGRSARQSSSFLDVFRRSSKFSEVQAVCRSLEESPLVGLFQAGYAELTAQLRQGTANEIPNGGTNPRPAAARPTLKSLSAVDRALMRASVAEVNKLEHRISFLATTASIAPFVGLVGTVWGIMVAFFDIGATGSTNLSAVAPGIAEALVTTAAGIATAIPAVVAYNYFSQRVKLFASAMDDFALEFLNIAERNFT
jgi:biopolymer transport protein TolQ